MRILIIEDEVIIARFIEKQLQNSYGFETAIALSIDEVELLVPTFQPHLILCDIELNDRMNGIALMHQLKKRHNFELIFITSYQSMQMINRAFELEPANYIIKPLDEGRLYAGILPTIKQMQEKLSLRIEEANPIIKHLSTNEVAILKLIANRKTTKEIASLLHLSPYTVKNYRHKICRKLNLEEENNALLSWSLKNYHLLSED